MMTSATLLLRTPKVTVLLVTFLPGALLGMKQNAGQADPQM